MVDLDEIRAKWKRYEDLLQEPEGDGSLIGRYFIIASTGLSDVTELCEEIERLRLIEEKARGLVRTASTQRTEAYIATRTEPLVVRQWWDGLVKALDG